MGGGRDGQLRPAAPALGMCHSTRRGVVSAEGRPAQEARGPCRPPTAPEMLCADAAQDAEAPRSKPSTHLPAPQGRPATPSGAGISQRPQRVAMAPPHERRLVECGAELHSNPRKAEPRRWSLPRFGFSR